MKKGLTPYIILSLIIVGILTSINLSAQTQIFDVILVSWGSATSPTEVGPGDISQLVVVLRNRNSIQSSTLTAYLDLPKGLKALDGSSRAITYYRHSGSSIPAGSVIELQFKVKVDEGCGVGTYNAKLTVEWVSEVLYYSRTYTEEIYVGIPITGRPDVKVILSNDESYPGTRDISIRLVNEGSSTANNVSLEITTTPTVYINVSKVNVGEVQAGSEVLIPVKVNIDPSLAGSTLSITATVTYSGLLGSYVATSKAIINVKQYVKPVINVSLNTYELLSGSVVDTYLVLTNVGNVTINNIVIKLSTQQPIQLLSTSVYTLDTLDPGNSELIPMKLTSIPTSTYLTSVISLTIDYIDSYGVGSSKSFSIPVIIKPVREQPLIIELLTKEVIGGANNTLTFKLSNIGSVDVTNILMQVVLPQGIIPYGLSQIKLDVIKSNESIYVSFDVLTPYTDSVQYTKVSCQVSYYDTLNNYFSRSDDFTLAIKPKDLKTQLMVDLMPKELKAISEGVLRISLTSAERLSNVRLSVSSASSPVIVSSDEFLVGILEPANQSVIELPYKVLNKPGTYTLSINVKYVDALGVSRTSTYTYVIKVLPAKVVLSVDLSPRTLISGREESLFIRVSNVGDSNIRDLTLNINLQSSILTILNESRKYYVAALSPGEGVNTVVLVRANYITSYTAVPISITVTYYDDLNQQYSDTFLINVGVEPEALASNLAVEIGVGELMMAKVNNITLKIVNVGRNTVEGITCKFTAGTALSVIGSNEFLIDRLEPNNAILIQLPVYVAMTSQYTSTIAVSFNYLDKGAGMIRNEDKVLTFLIRGVADLRVTDYVVMPTTVSPGQTFSITLTLINVGVIPAYSTFITPLTTGLPLRSITEERSIYLGNIDTGSTTAATITLQLINTSERIIRLPIVISFLDNLRTQRNITVEIPIRVSNQTTVIPTYAPTSTTSSSYLSINQVIIYTVIALIALGGFIAWRRVRGRS